MESFWSTSVMKKKKFRFGVELRVANLSNYALATGVLFAKVRLEERANGDFEANTERVSANHHRANWDQAFSFSCKMYAKPQVGVLEECPLRVSVRKEGKSGKTEKLGYASLNLAEFAGMGTKERRCLLQSYDTNNLKGCDNSILLISVNVSLEYGDPVFSRPASTSPNSTLNDPTLDQKSFAGDSPRGTSAAATSGEGKQESSATFPGTPRRPPQLLQNFLSRRGSLMPSILAHTFMREETVSQVMLDEPAGDRGGYGYGDAISIGSNELSAELLDPDSTLMAQASTATILASADDPPSSKGPSSHDPTAASKNRLPSRSAIPAVAVQPISSTSLDSAFDSTCSSTALQQSMNGDRHSFSSATNSASLRFSSPDLIESAEQSHTERHLLTERLNERGAKLLVPSESSDASISESCSAPATVRGRKSIRQDLPSVEDVKFYSLETASRQIRTRKVSRPAHDHQSIKSSGRSSVASMNRDSFSSIKTNVENTRVDASELIDSLITKSTEDIVDAEQTLENSTGLQLYIGVDGSTAVAGKSLHNRPISATHYRKVHMGPKKS